MVVKRFLLFASVTLLLVYAFNPYPEYMGLVIYTLNGADFTYRQFILADSILGLIALCCISITRLFAC